MMARSPRDEFGTPFGQAGSAAAAKLGTPFGQAGSAPKKPTVPEATVTIGGAPAGYQVNPSTNFITGAGIQTGAASGLGGNTGTGTGGTGGNTPDPNEGFTTNGNQALYKGVPFNGMRNGIQFINGYRQDMYDEKGNERTNKPKGTGDATQDLLLEQQRRLEEEAKLRDRQSAYDILYNEFNKYGLGGLVEDIKYLLQSNVSPSQFSLELQNRPAYQARFSANKERIANGLRALSPAEYIGLEDQYQNVMRNYGLPASYYTKDKTGKQPGFDKFLEGDVSAAELEDRVVTAQQRVINSNPQVLTALKQFYPDITNGDILAYTLDPKNALTNIKQKVTAAEIQGAADVFGLNRITAESTPDQIKALEARAQALAGYGVDKAAATEGFAQVAEIAPRGSQLADIYKEAPYTQATAESEVFRTSGAAEAKAKRKKLTALEQASFSGSSGVGQGAIGRDRGLGQGQF
jgi:hypothetical protein